MSNCWEFLRITVSHTSHVYPCSTPCGQLCRFLSLLFASSVRSMSSLLMYVPTPSVPRPSIRRLYASCHLMLLMHSTPPHSTHYTTAAFHPPHSTHYTTAVFQHTPLYTTAAFHSTTLLLLTLLLHSTSPHSSSLH